MSGLLIAPSVLSADFGRLAGEVRAVDRAGADWIHVDIMDGRLVLEINFGPLVGHHEHREPRGMKQLIAFDLDGTLAESKQAIGEEMAGLLKDLLDVAKISVISGGDWLQFDKQVAQRIPAGAKLENLFLMPTTGSKLYRFHDGAWTQVYADTFTPEEHQRIVTALDKAVKAYGFDKEMTWGQQIEDRGSQITFSALGQEAPLNAKKAWDPDIAKRKQLQAALESDLSDLSVKVGGSTSIDITRRGIDKAYAIHRLAEHAGVPEDAILFMGDAIYPGGNDDPVRAAGIDTVAVRDVQETGNVIRGIVACMKVSQDRG